jgi:tetratricopeptide (TPR) repeat protein
MKEKAMAKEQASSGKGSGKAFFDRADEVAETGNWDFAIELYLEGIRREPGNIERGHTQLRRVAMMRKAKGGKPAGMMDALKHRSGRDKISAMANAEYLWAKDPGSASNMIALLKAARAVGENSATQWIAQIVLESQTQQLIQGLKPNKAVLQLLIEVFTEVEEYASALRSCEMALKLSPNDGTLQEINHDLSAKYTIKRGRYEEERDFTAGVKNLDSQKELIQKDSLVQTDAFLSDQAEKARKEYEEAPTVPGKINSYVDALLKSKSLEAEKIAMTVLTKAYEDSNAYQFKMRLGDIKMAAAARQYRQAQKSGDKDAALEVAKHVLALELQEYTERAAAYPTDLAIKYELGKRKFMAGQYDDAIGLLQQAQRDPRRHVMALNYLGLAFRKKEWYQEASETFEKALKADISEDRKKDIFYNLGDVYEHMGQLQKARDMFSELAQMDFTYKDVRDRMDQIREKLK